MEGFVLGLVRAEEVTHQTVGRCSDYAYQYSSSFFCLVDSVGREKLLEYFGSVACLL